MTAKARRTCRSLALLSLVLVTAACDRAPREIELSGPTMGTVYLVKVVAPPGRFDAAQARGVIDDVLQQIDRQMSGYRPDSEITRFNRSRSTDWIAVSSQLAAIVAASADISDKSAGALDLTVRPLVDAWGMGPPGERKDVPGQTELDETRTRVGYRLLHARMQPPALRKDTAGLEVDLNAVASGFAVDVLARRLASLKIDRFMIDIGGEVRARGTNGSGEPWRIAVERPIDTEPEPYAVVQLRDMAITTSGEYRHYVMRGGHRYSHTIDPRTGRPVDHKLASVAVVMPTAFEADAWSTAFNVLGEDAGYALASDLGIAAMFIVDKGGGFEPRMTPAFRRYLAVAPQSVDLQSQERQGISRIGLRF